MALLRAFKPFSSTFCKWVGFSGGKIIALAVLSGSLSFSATIFDSGVAELTITDPIQMGRLGRTNVPSDWSTPKSFPGTLNPSIAYHYETFVLDAVLYPYIQITIDDLSRTAQTFASAYLNAYLPNSTPPDYGLDTNYLGDAGNSGNYFGTDPRAFQVAMPIGGTLVVLVNDATGAGLYQPFRLLVEGFVDTNFSTAPEPASFGLILAAAGAGAFFARKRKKPAE